MNKTLLVNFKCSPQEKRRYDEVAAHKGKALSKVIRGYLDSQYARIEREKTVKEAS